MQNKRNRHNPALKAKVALAAVQEQQTVADIAKRFGVHPNQVSKWKRQLLDNITRVFEPGAKGCDSDSEREAELLKKIGELTVERDFLSRVLGR